jgi:predicted AlkP superfamily pyrophosphatase or phosphodiesterase
MLRALASEGVRAERLVSVFPSATFPNAYSMVTGLFPVHHGIVANKIVDATDGATFAVRDSAAVSDPRWWKGEPIWATAIRQGREAIVIHWPGSKAPTGGVLPTAEPRLAGPAPSPARVARIVDWLSADRPPALVAVFLHDVDQAGHRHGPDSPQVDSAIARVDEELGALRSALDRAGLAARVNVVIAADHGMADIDAGRQIFLADYLDLATVETIELSPVGGLTPRSGGVDQLYRRLAGRHPHMQVFRSTELSDRWSYGNDPRVPPILLVADEGWFIAARRPGARFLGGDHGYDPELASMGGVFVARGPSFRRGAQVPPFRNVHLYELLARAMGLQPAANDGRLDSVRAVLSERAVEPVR